jgi:hypothetical protein
LRRIKKRVPKEKIVIIAEAIFNSLLRYDVAVFLKPVYEKKDLNMEKNPKNTATLQTRLSIVPGLFQFLVLGTFWTSLVPGP